MIEAIVTFIAAYLLAGMGFSIAISVFCLLPVLIVLLLGVIGYVVMEFIKTTRELDEWLDL